MTKAYELSEPFAQVESDLDLAEYTEATTPRVSLAMRLDGMWPNGVDFDYRAEQLVRWERNLAVEKAALLEEIKRLQQKRNAVENRREAVRDYLRGLMLTHGQRKFKTPVATATVSPGRERIVLDEERVAFHVEFWPADIYRSAVVKQPPKVNKTVLARDFADRLKDLPGVSVEVGEDVLTIR